MPLPVEIGTTRPSTSTLRIVQGTIGSSRATTSSAAAGEAGPPATRRADPDRGEDDEGGADEEVLGPEHRGQAEEQARQQPGPQALPFAAQRKASTAAGRVRIAGGSLISSPVEWMKGG